MKEPLVSVSMITYNHEPYIRLSIEGVLQQKTNFPFELVIGEDCSTDGTRNIVLEYAAKYPEIIKLITSDNNVGAKRNSKRTREACRGKYIAFCEGDDYWHRSDKLQLQIDFLEKQPECGVIHSDFDMVFCESGRRISNYQKYRGTKPRDVDFLSILNGASPLRTCTVVCRSDLISQVVNSDTALFLEERFLMGDTQLWAELARVTQIAYIEESLATYNYLSESASRSNDIVKELRFLKSALEMRLYLYDKYEYMEERERCNNKLWAVNLRLAFVERNNELGRESRHALGPLTFRNRLLYLGTQNVLVHSILKGLWTLFNRARLLGWIKRNLG